MKYVFFGSPEFAAIVLKKLISAGFLPSAVVCNPDRPVGRKKTITPPPTKDLAQKHKIKVLQPEKLEIGNWKLEIGEVDFAVVAAYSQIIPKEILSIPRIGTIGVHPSLLPKYRGATPIQSAILNGEKETGVTLYLMDEKMDHGPILANSKLQTSNFKLTYIELHDKLAGLAGNLLVEVLPKFLKGEIIPIEQNHAEATFTKKFTTEDAYIDPEDLRRVQGDSSGFALGMTKRGHSDPPAGGEESLAIEIDRKVRALNPEPGTWTMQGGKRIKILEAEVVAGKLRLKKIQKEGGKPQVV